MTSPLFDSFRLVGGTALSLQKGHRISIYIDLFSDAPNIQTLNIKYMMLVFIKSSQISKFRVVKIWF